MSIRAMKYFFFLFLLAILFFPSCKKDDGKLSPQCDGSHPTYDTEIRAIITRNCMGAHCHSVGSPHGNWTVYSGMSVVIANGAFKREVLTDQTMPQGSAVLGQDEINKIQCWVNDGYPEN